jgi:hypothetical protein
MRSVIKLAVSVTQDVLCYAMKQVESVAWPAAWPVAENGGSKGRCVGERERGKRRREKERGGRCPD